MKKARSLFIVLTAAFTVLAMIGSATPVQAADGDMALSDTQVEQIRQNCKQAQSTLQRLQSTDVATRVNRGRIYENLLNRLIAPFNARVSFNRYDASSLTSASATITQKFAAFKSDYQSYADAYANLVSMNCEANPRGFYDQLTTVRAGREKISNDIADLNSGLDQYTGAFNSLKSSIGGQ